MNVAASTVVERLDIETQRRLLDQVRAVKAASPFVRPRTPNGLPMRVRVTAAGELGWVGDGEYRYSKTDSRGHPWPAMPEEWKRIAKEALVRHHDYARDGAFMVPRWDSAIINWYDPTASLGWHVDRSEADTSLPIVTISLGDAASFALRSDAHEAADNRIQVHRTRLESGDVNVLAGALRNCEHTIERIIPDELFSPLRNQAGEPTRGRISITIRQAGL